MNIKLILFGRPQILYHGVPVDIRVKKAIALLAYLATTGKTHSRERLATLFWPDSKEDVARSSLRQVTQALKSTPLAAALLTDRTSIGLHSEVDSDVRSFLSYTNHNDHLQNTLSLEAVARLQAAEALYQDDFLQDFSIPGSVEWEDWQDFRRIEFQYLATCVVAALTRYYVEQGLADSGSKMAARWLEMDPYNEEAHHLAMHLYMLGHQTERALAQYHVLVRLLEREQQRPPGPEIQHTYERIRQGQYQAASEIFPTSTAKVIRDLLPRPPDSPARYERDLMIILQALNIDKEKLTSLIVIYDQDNRDAPGLIASVAHRDKIRDVFLDGILWAALESSDDFEAVLRLWLDAMRVSILKSTSKLEHLAWQFHNGQRGKRLLFLLENVTEAHHARLLMPGYAGCTLIITTSDYNIASDLLKHAASLITLPSIAGRHSSPSV